MSCRPGRRGEIRFFVGGLDFGGLNFLIQLNIVRIHMLCLTLCPAIGSSWQFNNPRQYVYYSICTQWNIEKVMWLIVNSLEFLLEAIKIFFKLIIPSIFLLMCWYCLLYEWDEMPFHRSESIACEFVPSNECLPLKPLGSMKHWKLLVFSSITIINRFMICVILTKQITFIILMIEISFVYHFLYSFVIYNFSWRNDVS